MQDTAVLTLASALREVRPLTATEQRIVDMMMGKAAYRRWTDTDDQKLLQMHKAGIHGEQMALTLGRTAGTVRVRLHKLKKAQRAK